MSGDISVMQRKSGSNTSRRSVLRAALALPMLALAGRAEAQGARWLQLPGAGNDIGAGGGKVCVIGTNRSGDGYGIYRWNGRTSGDAWDKLPGGGTNIAVDGKGNPWVTTDRDGIYRWNGAAWEQLPGAARDIGIGGGKVYVIGNNQAPGGFGIYRWNGSPTGNAWDRVPGGAVRIAVDRNGSPWVVNDQGNIYLWANGRFEPVPGKANDIGCGGDEVYVVGYNSVPGGYGIYRYAGLVGGRPWESIPGGAVRIAADDKGKPWVVNDAGKIYRG
jgi:hypothetical protein